MELLDGGGSWLKIIKIPGHQHKPIVLKARVFEVHCSLFTPVFNLQRRTDDGAVTLKAPMVYNKITLWRWPGLFIILNIKTIKRDCMTVHMRHLLSIQRPLHVHETGLRLSKSQVLREREVNYWFPLILFRGRDLAKRTHRWTSTHQRVYFFVV